MRGFSLKRPAPGDGTGEIAAKWALLRENGELSDADERRFADWLAESEGNVAAYADASWALDAVARNAGSPQMLALRNAALSARGDGPGRWIWGGLGVAASALTAFILWAALPGDPSAPDILAVRQSVQPMAVPETGSFRTGIGQRSSIELPDGSVVTLDTDTQVRVAYSSTARAVHLINGQALFEVARGKPLPFQVFARGQRITAVGTVFNVRIVGQAVKVSMVEGKIRVARGSDLGNGASAPAKELTLRAGEAAVVESASAAVLLHDVDTRQVVSWKGGLLVFNDTPLSEAVAEINRYTERPIAVADTAIGGYRISGVFKSNDADHFSRAMAEVFPIEVTRAPDGAPVLKSRAP